MSRSNRNRLFCLVASRLLFRRIVLFVSRLLRRRGHACGNFYTRFSGLSGEESSCFAMSPLRRRTKLASTDTFVASSEHPTYRVSSRTRSSGTARRPVCQTFRKASSKSAIAEQLLQERSDTDTAESVVSISSQDRVPTGESASVLGERRCRNSSGAESVKRATSAERRGQRVDGFPARDRRVGSDFSVDGSPARLDICSSSCRIVAGDRYGSEYKTRGT